MTLTETCVDHCVGVVSAIFGPIPTPSTETATGKDCNNANINPTPSHTCNTCQPVSCSCRMMSLPSSPLSSLTSPLSPSSPPSWSTAKVAPAGERTPESGTIRTRRTPTNAHTTNTTTNTYNNNPACVHPLAPSTAIPSTSLTPSSDALPPQRATETNKFIVRPCYAPITLPSTCSKCESPYPSSAHTTRSSNALNSCRGCRVYTADDLAQHSKREDLWISISGVAYNVTAFLTHHPGGIIPILDVAGCDASDVFNVFHTSDVRTKLARYQVGIMGEFDSKDRLIDGAWSETPMQQDFYKMVRQLEADGQFETNLNWYLMKAAVQVAMFVLAIGLPIYIPTPVSYFLSACVLGMFWQQLAFLGHDLGHNSVRGSQSRDWFGGILVTAFFGVSVQWWKHNHNVHHVVTNSLEHDPDIQHLPIFSITEKAFKGYYSSYFEKAFSFDLPTRILVGNQHHLYYPIMCIARLNLYAQSFILMFNLKKQVPQRGWELGALAFFWGWYILFLSYLPPGSTRFWYFMLSHAVAGLVHVQITLSHFSMPVYEGRGYSPQPGDRDHFIKTQFATGLDVECPEWLDWLHGGLQFQVAHHLLPRVPRHRLRHVRENYVKPFARSHGLKYHEYPFVEASMTVYEALKKAALESRKIPQKFTDSYLWQFMKAEG